MNKRIYIPISVFLIFFLSQCGPTQQDAMLHHKQIVKEQHLVVGYVNELISTFSTYEPSNIEPALDSAKMQVEKSIIILEGMEPFDDEYELLSACSDLFKVYKSQLNNEYAELLELFKLPIEEYKEKEEDRLNELNKIIDEGYYPVYDKFSKTEEDFAKKWGFELIPADL